MPAKGVERWLAQRLSTRARGRPARRRHLPGVAFPSHRPARRRGARRGAARAGRTTRGRGRCGRCWRWSTTAWASRGARVLAQHLGGGRRPDDHRRGRRWATAAHLAELFRSYGAARPQMLRDWAQGRDTDGAGPLPGRPALAGRAVARGCASRLGPSPAERLDGALRGPARRPGAGGAAAPASACSARPGCTTDQLAVLSALGERPRRAPLAAAPQPGAVAGARRARAPAGGPCAAGRPDGDRSPRHPLLRSLARDVRELQLRLPPHADAAHTPRRAARRRDACSAGCRPTCATTCRRRPARGSTAACRCTPATARPGRSRCCASCCCGLFEDDPTLEPRDVLVLCPDVETFAPLVSAAFGLGAGLPHPGHAPAGPARRPQPAPDQPAARHVAGLLDLAGGRVTAGAVLDLAATPAVRRPVRARPTTTWSGCATGSARSGVRWGLDAGHRAAVRAGPGARRTPGGPGSTGCCSGSTTSEDEPVWLGLALPLDDVDSSDIDLAGRLAELLDRLERRARRARPGSTRPAHWVDALAARLDLLTATAPADAWQLAQARRELAEAGEGGDAAAAAWPTSGRCSPTGCAAGRPARTSAPATSPSARWCRCARCPHRVVVLLGLDDGVFPRTAGVDGDDVLARDPLRRRARRPQRGPPAAPRRGAGRRASALVVLYTGADPVSGARRPPAVPLGELLDVVERDGPRRRDASSCATRCSRYDAAAVPAATRRSASTRSRSPARAPGGRGRAAGPAARARCRCRGGPVALDDLVAFVEHPVRGLPAAAAAGQPARRGRRGRRRAAGRSSTACRSGRSASGCCAAGCAGSTPRDARRAEWLRGTLPPGPLGGAVLSEVGERVEPLVDASAPLLAAPPRGGRRRRLDRARRRRALAGTVDGVRDGAVVSVTNSTLSAAAPRPAPGCWPSPSRPPARATGPSRSAAAAAPARVSAVVAPRGPRGGAARAGRAGRPARPRAARAAADGREDLGGLRRRPRRRRHRRAGAGERRAGVEPRASAASATTARTATRGATGRRRCGPARAGAGAGRGAGPARPPASARWPAGSGRRCTARAVA